MAEDHVVAEDHGAAALVCEKTLLQEHQLVAKHDSRISVVNKVHLDLSGAYGFVNHHSVKPQIHR